MSPEEIQALLAENATLRAEVLTLRPQVTEVTQQLQAAMVRVAELEAEKSAPPPFVKPNRPPKASQGPRKKRAPEHNTSRKRAQPTRIERHGLAHCPDCG